MCVKEPVYKSVCVLQCFRVKVSVWKCVCVCAHEKRLCVKASVCKSVYV